MDKESVKDIVGRPKWWLVNVPIMVVFVVVGMLLLPDDADGAVAAQSARTCPSGEWSCYTADRYAAEFLGDLFEETSRITVFCGGLAVIGSLAGGGAWGAGRAAGACLWARLMGIWE